jgi:lipoate-protein ligase A
VKTSGLIRIIDFTSRDGAFNMALDRHLFSLCESGAGCGFLRLYTWDPPALSLGFHEPERIIDMRAAREAGVDVVRRPTGGRVVLHKNDLTYTVVLPFALSGCPGGPGAEVPGGAGRIYRLISECLVDGLASLSNDLIIDRGKARGPREGARPCFASTSRYEITHHGRKVVGSAQRVGRRSVLQHGSIPVGRDYLEVAAYLDGVDRSRLREEVARATTCLEDIAGGRVDIGEIAQNLRAAFPRGLDLEPVEQDAETCARDMSRSACGEYAVTLDDNIT